MFCLISSISECKERQSSLLVEGVSEPEFVNLLRSPGIDSQPGGPVRQPYLKYRPAWLHKLAESIPGLLKRLRIRAQIGADLTARSTEEDLSFYVFEMVSPPPPSANTAAFIATSLPLS